jgi:hypothetical protein
VCDHRGIIDENPGFDGASSFIFPKEPGLSFFGPVLGMAVRTGLLEFVHHSIGLGLFLREANTNDVVISRRRLS